MEDLRGLLNQLGEGDRERALQLSEAAGFALPSSYVEFMAVNDGAVGNLGTVHLTLYTAEQAKHSTAMFRQFDALLFLIGSDGGGEAFCIDPCQANSFCQIPFLDIGERRPTSIGADFLEFLHNLYHFGLRYH